MPDNPEKDSRIEDPKEKLLRQIRDDFAYVRAYWHKNYENAAKCMDCMAGIPPKEFTDDRANRPCIWPDETSQYVNQANNNLRQNKRSIKLSPKGEQATDKDAEHRQAYIQSIIDASNGQSIFTTGYESAVQCGFGSWRLTHVTTGPNEEEPRLRRIPNWATVYFDPDAKEADFSDQSICFVIDSMRESTFERKYPKAQKRSFTAEDRAVAPDWLNGGYVVVAEYWTREEEETEDGEKTYKVTQRITNGVEILKETEWIGSWIPIIGVFGKEMYVKTGGQSKRLFFSMIQRGLPAQQMMAYIASQEAEEFGMAPRAPFVGYKGTFVNADKTWRFVHKVPMAYLEVDLPKDWPAGTPPPPLPSRPQFSPNPQAYEIAYERWRRSHQAAVAGTPLPTDAQKVNDKSGIALERIENAGMLGNFHFMDNFGRALRNTGEQINELITLLAKRGALPKQVLGKDQKGEDVTLHIAKEGSVPPEKSEHLPEAEYFFAHRGKFTVTISEGPHHASEREEQSDFADTLITELPRMGLPPQITQQVLAIAVKLKNIGSFGDELHDILAPPDPNNLPPQAKAVLAQAQATIAMLKQELQKLQIEKMGKTAEIQGKKDLALLEHASRLDEADKDRETKLAVAEISTKAQDESERKAIIADIWKQLQEHAHELAMATQQQAHEKEVADQQAANASAQSAQDAAQNQQAQEPSGGQ